MTRKRKKGNRLSSLTDDAGAVTLQGAADVAPYAGTGAFSYDSRGRLTRDMTRGITRITYNHLGLPVTVTLSNGNSALFTYSGEGEKLRALYTATDMALFGQGATPVAVLVTTRVDYRPGHVYVGGGLAYAQVPGGYCTVSEDTLSAHMTVSDYRGDVRSVIAEDGRVEERNDYYPYGMAFYSPAASVQPWKHSGKEHESRLGIHWLDFGARRLDFAKGQWTTVDPLCEKTPWQSPYAYCGADPVNYIDLHGDSISFWGLLEYDRIIGANSTEMIVKDLNALTGLNLYVDNNMLKYQKDNNGNPTINTNISSDGSASKMGSETARSLLISGIDNEQTVEVNSGKITGVPPGTNIIGVNGNQISKFLDGTHGMDNRTLGWGMVFMHEFMHTTVGGELKDCNLPWQTGPVVDTMNIIRSELNIKGGNYGLRMQYNAMNLHSKNYLPFDKVSAALLRSGFVPFTKYISF